MITVLVVDDALADRALISGLLNRQLECEILEAGDGREALSILEAQNPDLVLTDLNMPEMDGLQLVSAVKENYPRTPVVLMTAQGSEEIAARALRSGAASYVPKHLCAEHLADTVTRILSGARQERLDPHVMHYLREGQVHFTLHNDTTAIESLVTLFQQMLRCLPLGDETERLRVGVAVEAAMLNACFRGNLELSHEKGRDRATLISVARDRIGKTPYRDRRIDVRANIDHDQATFIVRDGGPGFDTSTVLEELDRVPDPENTGRGITLMRTIMDEVRFNESGNEVTLVKRRYEPPEDDEDYDDEDDD